MDLRTERTKHSIINAFIELRSKKPLEKITVKELSELAYINKATFYSHYHDIYDLSEQLEDELISSALKSIPYPDNLIANPRQGVEELSLALHSQNKLIHTLFADNRAPLFATKLEAGLKDLIYKQYPDYKNNLECNILLSVLILGCLYAFTTYSTNDNLNDVVNIIGEINDCLIQNYLVKIGVIVPSHSDM